MGKGCGTMHYWLARKPAPLLETLVRVIETSSLAYQKANIISCINKQESSFFFRPSQASPHISIIFTNVRSLLPKIDFLRLEAASLHPHIICLTETWLSSSIQDSEITIAGYKVYRLDRNRQGGGVITYVSNNLQSQLLMTETYNLELMWIKVVADRLSLTLGVFYRPPSTPVGSIDTLECSLEDINPLDFNTVVLVGDFNINFSNEFSSPLKSRLLQLMYKFNLTQVVNQFTHISPNGKSSLIDLALIANSDRCVKCEILPPVSSSDHYTVELALKMQLPSTRPNKETRTLWLYRQADFVLARHLINRTYWDFLITDEVETSWVQWKSAFLENSYSAQAGNYAVKSSQD